ncbi:30S ribosomal protein S21 [Candidatus Poribacteria bacterium]|nr:MAG: 30S ribosomal protein S21 [Candidatus Poribacteria bacterium]
MPYVRAMDGESIDEILKRFKKKCEKEELFKEIRRRLRYESRRERERRRLHRLIRKRQAQLRKAAEKGRR